MACPATTSRSSKGWTKVSPRSRGLGVGRGHRVGQARGLEPDRRAVPARAVDLADGRVPGHEHLAGHARGACRARERERVVPCAPRHDPAPRAAAPSASSLATAPRSLNAPVRCRFSVLSSTGRAGGLADRVRREQWRAPDERGAGIARRGDPGVRRLAHRVAHWLILGLVLWRRDGYGSTVSVSRPERISVPGRSPVAAPARTVSAPFTKTCSTPSESATRRELLPGRSAVMWTGPDATVAGSKTVMSAWAPTPERPRSRRPNSDAGALGHEPDRLLDRQQLPAAQAVGEEAGRVRARRTCGRGARRRRSRRSAPGGRARPPSASSTSRRRRRSATATGPCAGRRRARRRAACRRRSCPRCCGDLADGLAPQRRRFAGENVSPMM